MRNLYHYQTVLGRIGMAENGAALTNLFFAEELSSGTAGERETPLLREAAAALAEYLAGERRYFDLPLDPQGTEFQKAVWKALLDIPYGETRCYKEIAGRTGRMRAFRAVGMASKKNPLAIIIPCHRVIGSNGSLTGYAGGLERKRLLLELEKGNRDSSD